MNSSANTSNPQGDPNWATGNWDQSGATGSFDQTTRQYTANVHLEWLDYDPMILAQHPGSGCSNDSSGGDYKNHLTHAGTTSSLRPYNTLSARLPPNFTQMSMGSFNSAAMWDYAALNTSSNLPPPIHTVFGSSDIPGLAATGRAGLHSDLQGSFEDQQHQEFCAGMQQDHYMVKREDITHCYTGLSMNGVRNQQNVSDGCGAPLGLNLGVRTYFSMDDTSVGGQLGKRHQAGSPGSRVPMCQAEGCMADLSRAKHYHRRHKVCELHSKAPNVVASGHPQRFCQQCSRFHFLVEFDNGKRSCRKRLADHNRRRRKPQQYALTYDTTAESMDMKGEDDSNLSGSHATDPKSMLLKKCGSPSSALLEECDEQPGSAGNKLQLHMSGATLGRAPGEDQQSSQSVMQMTSQPMRSSEPQAKLLPTVSTSPPSLPMLHNGRHQLPMMTGTANHPQGTTVYQQYLQGFNLGQSGHYLSLSSLGGQGQQPRSHGQPMPGETYKGIDVPVPWIKTITSQASDLDQVVGKPGALHLQHLLSTVSKVGQSRSQSVTSAVATSNPQDPNAQLFPPNDQNHLPLQISSGDVTGSEWLLGSLTGEQNPGGEPNHFGPSSQLLCLSGSCQLEGQQMLETSMLWTAEGHNASKSGSGQNAQDRNTPKEVLQQHNTRTGSGRDQSTLTLGSAGGCNLKYPELHIVRPYGTSSIYDSHQNLL